MDETERMDRRMEAAERIIAKRNYEGIRDQDGWETLEATVRSENSAALADLILGWLA